MAEFDKTDGAAAREMITFLIGIQEFCIDVMLVREIRGWRPATPVAHAPGFVSGVINLRGTVLPIIDFAARLGLPADRTDDPPRHSGRPDRQSDDRPFGRGGVGDSHDQPGSHPADARRRLADGEGLRKRYCRDRRAHD